jgi:uncharacterized membrane protein HdeD (DUF308 family)
MNDNVMGPLVRFYAIVFFVLGMLNFFVGVTSGSFIVCFFGLILLVLGVSCNYVYKEEKK